MQYKREDDFIKGFILDSLIKSSYYLVVVIFFAIIGLIWLNSRGTILSTVPANSAVANQITALGNNFYLTGMNSVLVFLYFIFVAAMFISAIAIGGGPLQIPIGIAIGIVCIIVSLPIADTAHAILYNSALVPITSYYPGALYIFDHLPFLTTLEIVAYLIFTSLVAERVRESLGIQGASGGGGRYFRN